MRVVPASSTLKGATEAMAGGWKFWRGQKWRCGAEHCTAFIGYGWFAIKHETQYDMMKFRVIVALNWIEPTKWAQPIFPSWTGTLAIDVRIVRLPYTIFINIKCIF